MSSRAPEFVPDDLISSASDDVIQGKLTTEQAVEVLTETLNNT